MNMYHDIYMYIYMYKHIYTSITTIRPSSNGDVSSGLGKGVRVRGYMYNSENLEGYRDNSYAWNTYIS
jgi:hypothetical protein